MNPPPIPNSDIKSIEDVRVGQRWITIAILLNLLCIIAGVILPKIAASLPGGQVVAGVSGILVLAAGLSGLVLSLLGVLRLSSGLGRSIAMRIVFVIAMFIPLLSLIVLATLSSSATTALRAAGYRVGLLGAGPKTA